MLWSMLSKTFTQILPLEYVTNEAISQYLLQNFDLLIIMILNFL